MAVAPDLVEQRRVGAERGHRLQVTPRDDPETLVGRTESFRITQVRRGGADVVLSRRALIEDARKEEAAAVRATLMLPGRRKPVACPVSASNPS